MKLARGTFYLMIAEGVFILSGWAIHIGSKRLLGLKWYGIFGILLSLLTLYRIFLATGVNRAVSKYISEKPLLARPIRRQAIKLQLVLGWLLCGVVFLAAPSLARWWQAPELTGLIRLTAFFLPVFGLYSVYRGTLNGLKLFGKEARVSIVYSLLKVAFLFSLIYLFGRTGSSRTYGAVSGYLIAIVGAMLLARFSCPRFQEESEETFPVKRIVAFAFPVVLFSFILSLIQYIDLYLVRALLPPGEADLATGYYTCAQQFARIPYMLLYALSLTLFPNISASASTAGREEVTSATIRKALRGSLLIVLPLACLIGAVAGPLIGWIYGPDSVPGGEALQFLIFGQTFLALLLILATIITAGGRPWLSFSLVAVVLAVDAALNCLLIPLSGIRGAGLATTLSCGLGMVVAGGLVFRHFRALVQPAPALKIVCASAVIYLAAFLLKPEGSLIPPTFIALGGVYLLLLLLTRAIDRNDWKMIVSLFQKDKPLSA